MDGLMTMIMIEQRTTSLTFYAHGRKGGVWIELPLSENATVLIQNLSSFEVPV